MSQESPYMSLVFEQTARADAAEARVRELEAAASGFQKLHESDVARRLETIKVLKAFDAKNKELEAQCAAMREALESLWAAVGDRLLAKGPLSREYANSVQSGIKAALSGDAGRALRDRVEALERVAGAARAVKKHGYCGDEASSLDAAVDIMDALEPKR